MELKVTEQKEDVLLSRKKIIAYVTFKGATPSKEDIKKQLASSLKADEKLMIIKNIFTSFGSETANVIAYQYINEEDMKKIEPKEKGKREKVDEEEAPKKEEAKEEPKTKKEEPKKEVKKEVYKEEPKKQEKR